MTDAPMEDEGFTHADNFAMRLTGRDVADC
jgi:hypothetical protein